MYLLNRCSKASFLLDTSFLDVCLLVNMKQKICLLSITASHYRELIYRLIDREFECDFIFGVDDTTVKRLDTSKLKRSMDITNKYIASSNWYRQSGISQMVKEYDVIINDLGIQCISSWWIMILAKFRKQKVFTWSHGWYGRESFVKKWMKRAYFGLSDGCFIYGNYARNLMIENGFKRDKLHVIHNSLNYDKQLLQRNALNKSEVYTKKFNNEYPVLIFIGRLTKVKKLDLLINAVSNLNIEGKNYNIVFVGDGSEREHLECLVKERNIDNQVWFYGACYDEKINAELIYNADLCVSPGNVGLTAMHTMMFGCPVLTHNDFKWQMPEFEAINEDVTGAFFEYDNVISLENAISNWFERKQGLREEVRKACYKEIDEEWNPHKQIEILKKVIYE